MYIAMKFGTGVHVFCWEVGVFNRSSFESVSCKSEEIFIVVIYIWLPLVSYVVFLATLVARVTYMYCPLKFAWEPVLLQQFSGCLLTNVLAEHY